MTHINKPSEFVKGQRVYVETADSANTDLVIQWRGTIVRKHPTEDAYVVRLDNLMPVGGKRVRRNLTLTSHLIDPLSLLDVLAEAAQ